MRNSQNNIADRAEVLSKVLLGIPHNPKPSSKNREAAGRATHGAHLTRCAGLAMILSVRR